MLTPLYEYSTLEWIWTEQSIRINLPSQEEQLFTGTYAEIVQALTNLGQQGWEVVACVANGDWLFWTLKRATS